MRKETIPLARKRKRQQTTHFVPPTKSTNNKVEAPDIHKILKQTTLNIMKCSVCLVCDARYNSLDFKVTLITDTLTQHLRNSLSLSAEKHEQIPTAILKYYDTSQLVPSFTTLLLSKKGILDNNKVVICNVCRTNILDDKMPKLAIANGLYIGEVPSDFTQLNEMEIAMCSKVQLIHWIITHWTGYTRYKKSSTYGCLATPSTPINLLPRNIQLNNEFNVTLCTPNTNINSQQLKPFINVSQSKYHHFCQFLKQNHPDYQNIEILNRPIDTLLPHIDVQQCAETNPTTFHNLNEPIVELARETQTPINLGDTTLLSHFETNGIPSVVIKASNHYVKSKDFSSIFLGFPDLFPYGTGLFHSER
ncbi:hypothetical protein HDV02_004116, partial [Globomyces sp. JEL0801]